MSVLDQLTALAGPARSRAVLDGQLPFEQLEWLGDSVLDVLVARHVARTAGPGATTAQLQAAHSALISDRVVIETAERLDLPRLRAADHPTRPLDRDAEHRRGDSVEAWAGAIFRQRSWIGAAQAAVLLIAPSASTADLLDPMPYRFAEPSPLPPALLETATDHGWSPIDPRWLRLVVTGSPERRRLAQAGAAVVEHAVAVRLLAEHPTADEGELSRRRADLTSGRALAARVLPRLPSTQGFPTGDRLALTLLGAALMDAGPRTAQRVAERLLFP